MAAAAGEIRAGKAFVEIGAKFAGLDKALNAAGKKLKAWGGTIQGWGTRVAAAGAAITTPLGAAAATFSAMGDSVAKMARRTGVSTEALSELGFAAEQSGAGLDVLEVGLRKMQRTIVDAASGMQTAVDALALLGITTEQLAALTPEDQFKLIADRMAAVQNPTLKAAAALQIFGRSGTQLLPMMEDGAAGIEALQQQARELGLTIGGKDAKAAEVFTDTINIMRRSLKQVAFTIGSAVAPVLQDYAERATRIGTAAIQWAKANARIIQTVLKVAAGVTVAGTAMLGLGTAIVLAGTVLGALASIAGGIATAFAAVGGILTAILSPIGLVIAGLAGLAAYFLYTSGEGQKALDWLAARFKSLLGDATKTWKGITDALAAGDLSLAFKVLWTAIKMEWQRGINWLGSLWDGFKQYWNEATTGLAIGFTNAIAAIEDAWVAVTSSIRSFWVDLLNFLSKKWDAWKNSTFEEGLADKLAPIFARIQGVSVEETRKNLREDFAGARKRQPAKDAAADAQAKADKDKIAADAAARRKKIEDERQAAVDVLGADLNAANAEREKRRQAAQAEYDAAREEWNKARTEAAAAAGDAARQKKARPPAKGKAPDLEALDLAKKKTSVTGTFSAWGAAGLGTGIAERTAKAAEETARNTRELLRKKAKPLVFTEAPW